jgi:indole-3-glycerol phosphate synthase
MNSFLNEIIELKRKRLEIAKGEISFGKLKVKAIATRERSEPHALRRALSQNNKVNIIAEIKRASPSKGIINDKIDVAEAARQYEKAGACAVSVLTEEDKFQGSLDDLRTVRVAISLPILRKDFIFDEFQIYETAEAGADAVLLIAAMLDDEKLAKFFRLAEDVLGLDALVEVHSFDEMKRAEKIGAKIIGINNRDLNTFDVSLDVSRELIKHAPKNAFLISESGLQTRADLQELLDLGFKGFLIGETLMRSENASKTLENLR